MPNKSSFWQYYKGGPAARHTRLRPPSRSRASQLTLRKWKWQEEERGEEKNDFGIDVETEVMNSSNDSSYIFRSTVLTYRHMLAQNHLLEIKESRIENINLCA